jgi:2-C-methyl-D-erythritol 4-phosphate cytidylyltransferase
VTFPPDERPAPSAGGLASDEVGAVVVAAGRSARMAGLDKLFAPLGGRPLLARTLAAFQTCAAVHRVVLVLAVENLARGLALAEEEGLSKVRTVCLGGRRRQDSVREGLAALGPCAWVVVHDGARPLVTPQLIEEGLAAAQETGAAVCGLPAPDTIKRVDEQGRVLRTLDRRRLWLVQTPQVFRYDILLEAHERSRRTATDDAALVEHLGRQVRVCPGSPRNLKVTTPEDLALAEALLRV